MVPKEICADNLERLGGLGNCAEAIEKYCGEEMEAVDMFKHKK